MFSFLGTGLTFIAFTAWLLCNTRGLYKPTIVIAASLFFVWIFRSVTQCVTEVNFKPLVFFTAFFAILQAFSIRPLYPVNLELLQIHQALEWLVSALVLIFLFIPKRPGSWFFFTIIGLLLLLQAAVLGISPNPSIDVMKSNTLAVQGFLAGKNPYTLLYPDIYGGAYDYHPGFVYLPGTLYLLAPFEIIFRDIRAGMVAANALSTWIFYRLALSRVSRFEAQCWVLIFLLFPTHSFIVEQSWLDPVLLAALLLGVFSLERKRFAWAGISFGFAMCIKQYGFVLPLFIFLASFGSSRLTLRFVSALTLTLVALLAPFAWISWAPFVEQVYSTHTQAAVRLDSLSLLAFMHHQLGFSPSLQLSLNLAILGFGLSGLSVVWQRLSKNAEKNLAFSAALASCFAYGVSFYFGKFAFCNYHFFLSGMVILTLLLAQKAKVTTYRAQ